MAKRKRILWADYAKCLGIVAVVLGHAINRGEPGKALDVVYNSIYWWHMPLFFIIGGFFLKPIRFNLAGWRYLLLKRAKPLLLSYLFNGIFLILLSHFVRQQSWHYTWNYFMRLLYGGQTLNNYLSVFWFMTTYILGIIAAIILISLVKAPLFQILFSSVIFGIGIILQGTDFWSHSDFPWDALVVPLVIFWMVCGYNSFKLFRKICLKWKLLYLVSAILLYAVLIYRYAIGKLGFELWLKSDQITTGKQALLIPLALCFGVFVLCEIIGHFGTFKLLLTVGRNSEIIMYYHRAAFDITTAIAFLDHWYLRLLVGIFVPLLFAYFLRLLKRRLYPKENEGTKIQGPFRRFLLAVFREYLSLNSAK
ncbi:acyltransferase family protein [Liquorilactobacillus oeni]|nr:acyltransferase family protein [Liquorilactobacillus oeni]